MPLGTKISKDLFYSCIKDNGLDSIDESFDPIATCSTSEANNCICKSEAFIRYETVSCRISTCRIFTIKGCSILVPLPIFAIFSTPGNNLEASLNVRHWIWMFKPELP